MRSSRAYVVYMQSLRFGAKKKKKGTTFLNELQFQPITGGQAGHRGSCKQASVFLRRDAQEPPLLRADFLPSAAPIKVAFVWQRARPRISLLHGRVRIPR